MTKKRRRGFFRFQRRIKVLPGVRINFSKSGVSTTIGGRGAHVTIGKRGLRRTIGIPGTGISYTTITPRRVKSSVIPSQVVPEDAPPEQAVPENVPPVPRRIPIHRGFLFKHVLYVWLAGLVFVAGAAVSGALPTAAENQLSEVIANICVATLCIWVVWRTCAWLLRLVAGRG